MSAAEFGSDAALVAERFDNGRRQALADEASSTGEIVVLPLDQLGPGPKVRRETDLDHVNALVEAGGTWPPITVCTADWGRPYRVLDGNHRVAAAGRLGRAGLPAIVVEVDVKSPEAMELAVKANIKHGKPLTLSEKKSLAAGFIKETDWADNRIAVACGLTNKTVASMRPKPPRATSEIPKLRGADGRTRPASDHQAAERRRAAAKELTEKPTASDREVAKRTGLSPRTVADVRRRNEAGEDPAPPRLRAVPDPKPEPPAVPSEPKISVDDVMPSVPNDWMHHPAATRTNATRDFMRFLNRWGRVSRFQDERKRVLSQCPPDAKAEAVRNARWMAEQWTAFANELERQPTMEATE